MPGGRTRVFVAEDEALVAMMLEDALRDAGLDVLGPVATVGEALARLEDETPDVAVLDLDLGGEAAVPVADALAARGVPFVVATGYGADWAAAILSPRHSGAAVLVKPFDLTELSALVVRLARPAPDDAVAA